MKQVLVQTEPIHYVDSSKMIEFISINAPMVWNNCCDFVRYHDICNGEFGPAYWEKEDIINSPEGYNDEQVKWITAFFETHPWIERMMIVFDD
jgi:hypothetical protein